MLTFQLLGFLAAAVFIKTNIWIPSFQMSRNLLGCKEDYFGTSFFLDI